MLYDFVWAGIDVAFTKLTGNLLSTIKVVLDRGNPTHETFWASLHHEPLKSIVYMVTILLLLFILGGFVRLTRELVNSKFTMDMVFHMSLGGV